jgi:cytochrome c5
VSKQDTHFFNTFSLVIGLLVAVAIGLFAFSRIVASRTQEQQMLVDAQYVKSVEERVQPLGRVAVAGQDNTALEIEAGPAQGQAGAAAAAPTSATEVVDEACSACHGLGIAGAPKLGDKPAWAARIAQGKDMLYKHAIEGFQGKAGVMPPKGGRTDIPDDLIRAAVDHMVEASR